ncbi:MAG: PLP-dependent aspartate aminotransferase family protein, partial [Bacteroidia bacterium]|nr:PLP-dependent aspartate aminotransferase family protein [Bacteroidia bacterium]
LARKAHEAGALVVVDNTFATPILQNPIDFGIDVVIHSATKYLGGHSDICAGAVASTQKNMDTIWDMAKNLGGSLSDFTVWMLERSMKTLVLRVKAQQKNARKLAKYLNKHEAIAKVYYPGLKDHPDHKLAKKQMRGYGAMMSFDLVDGLDAKAFLKALKLIKPSMSLAGIESTIMLPSEASHSLLTPEERAAQGIGDNLIRWSVGIESRKDLIKDVEQAIESVSSSALQTTNS